MVIHKNFKLSNVLWYRIGGRVKYLLDICDQADFQQAIDFLVRNNLYYNKKYFIVGSGSNIIFQDEYYDGAVLRFISDNKKANNIFTDSSSSSLVTAFTGVTIDALIRYSFLRGLVGLEWAGGLPGTVGAGVRGNVGAFGNEIKNSFYKAEIVDMGQSPPQFTYYTRQGMHFAYRHSIAKENSNLVILNILFRLRKADSNELENARQIYLSNIAYRDKHHPVEYPTCGSVFKNITEVVNIQKILAKWPDIKIQFKNKWHGKIPMGYVLKRLGLSGTTLGGMRISTKHPNFIVNLGGGKAIDAVNLIKTIRTRIKKEFGFIPELEVEIIKTREVKEKSLSNQLQIPLEKKAPLVRIKEKR